MGTTCQKRTSNEHEDAIVSGRLSIDGGGAVLYLLERQVLPSISPVPVSYMESWLPGASLLWQLNPEFLAPQR
jgi:hypothetical protein